MSFDDSRSLSASPMRRTHRRAVSPANQCIVPEGRGGGGGDVGPFRRSSFSHSRRRTTNHLIDNQEPCHLSRDGDIDDGSEKVPSRRGCDDDTLRRRMLLILMRPFLWSQSHLGTTRTSGARAVVRSSSSSSSRSQRRTRFRSCPRQLVAVVVILHVAWHYGLLYRYADLLSTHNDNNNRNRLTTLMAATTTTMRTLGKSSLSSATDVAAEWEILLPSARSGRALMLSGPMMMTRTTTTTTTSAGDYDDHDDKRRRGGEEPAHRRVAAHHHSLRIPNRWPDDVGAIDTAHHDNENDDYRRAAATAREEEERRRRERQIRIRPPPSPGVSRPVATQSTGWSIHHHVNTVIPLPRNSSSSWLLSSSSPPRHGEREEEGRQLCRIARLDPNSRVLITGVLTQPLGPAVALWIAQHCQVRHIVGVDAILPNLRTVRVESMKVYRVLLRSIPEFQLVVSTSLGLSVRNRTGGRDDRGLWVQSFRPTHVIHLDMLTTSLLTNRTAISTTIANWSDIMSRSGQEMFTRGHSLYTMDDLFRNLVPASRQFNATDAASLPISTVVHVVSAEHEDETASSPHTTRSRLRTLSSWYHAAFGVSVVELQLPTATYGPAVLGTTTDADLLTQSFIHVRDAVDVILRCFAYQHGIYRVSAPSNSKQQQILSEGTLDHLASIDPRIALMTDWNMVASAPYGLYLANVTSPSLSKEDWATTAAENFAREFGIHRTRFPCASACRTSTHCIPSPFDGIIPISQQASSGCKYVVYLTNFSSAVDSLFQPIEVSELLCRIAFVSGESPIVQAALLLAMNRSELPDDAPPMQHWNGALRANSWTLVWLPHHKDSDLSDADWALPLIDPTRLFASSVEKALYTDARSFAESPDALILRVLEGVDRPAMSARFQKQYRPGTIVFRWVEVPPESGRKVALLVGELSSSNYPSGLSDYVDINLKEVSLPDHQVAYYHLVDHLVQSNELRPEREIQNTVYASFPYQWISSSVLIHDFKMDQSRQLRCAWYDELLYWGSNRHAEELSLTFVLARMRLDGSLGQPLYDDPSWIPLLTQSINDMGPNNGTMKSASAKMYVRILKRRSTE